MKFYLTLAVLSFFVAASIAQTLPPVAQALYDEAYDHDTLMGQWVLNHGGEVFPTQDSNSFYLKWFPPGSIPSSTPVIISLHGSNGYAFAEFYNWYQQAQIHGCGIIALQWYRGTATTPPDDYFNDTIICTIFSNSGGV